MCSCGCFALHAACFPCSAASGFHLLIWHLAKSEQLLGQRGHIRSGADKKNVLFVLSVFQATLTSSEDDSTGNLTLLTWTLWRATLATSAWISSAAETGDSESEDFVFLQWSSLSFVCLVFLEQRHFYLWRKIQRRWKRLLWICLSFIYWYTDQVHLLLRKTKLYSLRLGASCAAILIFILHIFVTVRLSSGPLSNDVCCELHTSHLLSLSRKVRFCSADCPT